jgi:signal transduction histidine kinase
MQLLNNIKYITGDPEGLNLQHRLLNASLFAVIVLNIVALLTNFILQLYWVMNVLNIITVFLFSILFFYSRKGGNQRLVEKIGFGFIILIFSPIMWFFNGGSNSSFQYYIPLIIVGIHVSATVKGRRTLIPLMIFMAMALMVVEYFHPEFVTEYPSRFVRYVDLLSGFFISLTGIYLFANVYFNQITEANNKLRMQNQHLTKIKEDLLVYQQKIKRQNSELEEKNKKLEELTATKNMFLAIISHDLRSPFNSLLGLTEILILNKEQINDQETLRLINSIHESAEQAYKLVLNLLEWSRLESDRIEYQPERVNLSTLVKSNIELVKIQAKNKEITIRYNNGIHDCVVYADKNMINTVVRNLISNALKYTNKGGRIEIDCTCSGEMCQVSIKDNGIGISEDLLEQILTDENKMSTKGTTGELGTGLGLVLCNEFARRNKGRISVESKLGKGSTFTLHLPVYVEN